MNIITRYQAKEIAEKELAKQNEFYFNKTKEYYGIYTGVKRFVDEIFAEIEYESGLGSFEAQVDLKIEDPKFHNKEYYEQVSKALIGFLQHLNYGASSSITDNGLFLWIIWE